MASHFFGLNDRTYRYSHSIGQISFNGPGFHQLTDVAVGKESLDPAQPKGVIYVVNRSMTELDIAREGIRVVMCTMDEDYLGDFGGYGEGDGKFIRPTSIALDSQQNVYVSDEWLQRISIFNKKGQFLDKWGTAGSKDGEFNRPSGLAFDKEDHLYLVDSGNNRVQVFTKDGKFLDKFGNEGSGNGEFNLPWGITIDDHGNVYLADWRNDRIQKFSPDGTFLSTFGSSGDLAGQFNRPAGVSVDKDGDIYVADWLNHRVQVFTPEFRFITAFQGDATISKWGMKNLLANPDYQRMYGVLRDMSSFQRFCSPVAVAVDDQGRVIIADGSRFRLQIYIKGEMLLAGYKG